MYGSSLTNSQKNKQMTIENLINQSYNELDHNKIISYTHLNKFELVSLSSIINNSNDIIPLEAFSNKSGSLITWDTTGKKKNLNIPKIQHSYQKILSYNNNYELEWIEPYSLLNNNKLSSINLSNKLDSEKTYISINCDKYIPQQIEQNKSRGLLEINYNLDDYNSINLIRLENSGSNSEVNFIECLSKNKIVYQVSQSGKLSILNDEETDGDRYGAVDIHGGINVRKNMFINGNLKCKNNLLFTNQKNNRIGINTENPQYLLDVNGTIKANEVILSNMRVDGTTLFTSTNNIFKDITVRGNTTLGIGNDDTLIIKSGNSTFLGNVNLNGNTNISGNISINKENKKILYVDYSTSKIGIGNSNPKHNLDIDGDLYAKNLLGNSLLIKGNGLFKGTDNRFSGSIIIDKNLIVSGNLSLGNELDECHIKSGIVKINNDLWVQKKIKTNELEIDNDSLFNKNLLILGDLSVKKNLEIDKSLKINNGMGSESINDGSLVVDGGIGISGNINIGSNNNNDSIHVKGNSYLKNTYIGTKNEPSFLVVSNNIHAYGSLNIKNNAEINGQLIVNNEISTKNLKVLNDFEIGNSEKQNEVIINSSSTIINSNNLDINSITTLNNKLLVTGETNFEDMTVHNKGIVCKNTFMVYHEYDTFLGGNLKVIGDTTFEKNIKTMNDVSIGDSENIDNKLSIYNETFFNNVIHAHNESYFTRSNHTEIKCHKLICENFNCVDSTYFQKNIRVDGDSVFNNIKILGNSEFKNIIANDSIYTNTNILVGIKNTPECLHIVRKDNNNNFTSIIDNKLNNNKNSGGLYIKNCNNNLFGLKVEGKTILNDKLIISSNSLEKSYLHITGDNSEGIILDRKGNEGKSIIFQNNINNIESSIKTFLIGPSVSTLENTALSLDVEYNSIKKSIINFDVNGNIGVGKKNPNYKLDINGDINCENINLSENGIENISKWKNTENNNNITYTKGYVGIGSDNPEALLHIERQDKNKLPTLLIDNHNNKNSETVGIHIKNSHMNSFGIIVEGNSYLDGKVGIGNNRPENILSINGKSGNIPKKMGIHFDGNENNPYMTIIGKNNDCGTIDFKTENNKEFIHRIYGNQKGLQIKANTDNNRQKAQFINYHLGINVEPITDLHIGGKSCLPQKLGHLPSGPLRLSNYFGNKIIDIGLDEDSESGWIQVNDSDIKNRGHFGSLLLNPLGGNIGISTTRPENKLTVNNGNIEIISHLDEENKSGSLIFNAYKSSDGGITKNLLVENDDIGKLVFNGWDNNHHHLCSIQAKYPGYLTFNMGNKSEEKIRITQNGNLGIGIKNPKELLEVDGNIRITDGNSLIIGNNTITGKEFKHLLSTSTNGVAIPNKVIMTDSENKISGLNEIHTQELKAESLNISNKAEINGNLIIDSKKQQIICRNSSNNLRESSAILFDREKIDSKLTASVGIDLTNKFFIKVNNSSCINIDTQGNIGIGTQEPQGKLHVVNNTSIDNLLDSEYIENSVIYSTSTQRLYMSNAIDELTVGRSYIQSSSYYDNKDHYNDLCINYRGGNVGIGENNPHTLFHLTKEQTINENNDLVPDINSIPKLTIESKTINNSYLNNWAGGIDFVSSGRLEKRKIGSFIRSYASDINSNGNCHDIVFGTLTDSDEEFSTEKLRITRKGNVGIGIENPDSKLHINGDLKVTGAIYGKIKSNIDTELSNTYINGKITVSNSLGIGTKEPTSSLHIQGLIDNSFQKSGIHMGTDVDGNYNINIVSINEQGNSSILFTNNELKDQYLGKIKYNCLERRFIFGIGNESILNIKENHNVGIGTEEPKSTLHLRSTHSNLLRLEKIIENNDKDNFCGIDFNHYCKTTSLENNNSMCRVGNRKKCDEKYGNFSIEVNNGLGKLVNCLELSGRGNIIVNPEGIEDSKLLVYSDILSKGDDKKIGFSNENNKFSGLIKDELGLSIFINDYTKLGINKNNIQIDCLTTLSALDISTTKYGSKINLFSSDNLNNYGFGISKDQLNYHVNEGGSHVFYSGGINGITHNNRELLRLTSNGYIGIGNSKPQYKLDVDGDLRITGKIYGKIVESEYSSSSDIIETDMVNTDMYLTFVDGFNGKRQLRSNNNIVYRSDQNLLQIGKYRDSPGSIRVGWGKLSQNNISINDNRSIFTCYHSDKLHMGLRKGIEDLQIYTKSTNLKGFISFAPNDIEQMRLNEYGNLGINTKNPREKLHVGGNIELEKSIWIKSQSSGKRYGCISVNNDILEIKNSSINGSKDQNYTGLTIRNNNVGIGIKNPNHQLDVRGDVNITGQLYCSSIISNSSNIQETSEVPKLMYINFTDGYNNHHQIRANPNLLYNPNDNYLQLGILGTKISNDYLIIGNDDKFGTKKIITENLGLSIQNTTDGENWNTQLRLDNNGSLGIGCIPDPKSQLTLFNKTIQNNKLVFKNSNIQESLIIGLDNDLDSTIWNMNNGQIRFGTNNIQRLVIENTGKIGIGTNNPDSLLSLYTNINNLESDNKSIFSSTFKGNLNNKNICWKFVEDVDNILNTRGEVQCYLNDTGYGMKILTENKNNNGLIIDSSGNLGICKEPKYRLDLESNSSEINSVMGNFRNKQADLIYSKTSINLKRGNKGCQLSGCNRKGESGACLSIFRPNNELLEVINVDSQGNVGLLKKNPESLLHLEKKSNKPNIIISNKLSNNNENSKTYLGGWSHDDNNNINNFYQDGSWIRTNINNYIDAPYEKKTYINYYNNGDVILGDNSLVVNKGKIGINNIDPKNELDVKGTINAHYFQGDGSKLTNVGDHRYWEKVNSGIVYKSGNLGIGNEPRVLLDIGHRKYIKKDQNINNISVISQNSIFLDSGCVLYKNDNRNYKNIKQVDTSDCLKILNKLKVTEYDNIDNPLLYKSITIDSDSVQTSFNSALVDDINDYIPNIYADSTSIRYDNNLDLITITLNKLHGCNINDELLIYHEKKQYEFVINQILNENTLIIFCNKQLDTIPQSLFIYGKKVSNIKALATDKLVTLSIGAIQQINNNINNSNKRVVELEEQNKKLLDRLEKIEKRLGLI